MANNRVQLLRILGTAFRWNRFPSFCALLITGSRIVEILLARISRSQSKNRLSKLLTSSTSLKFLATLLSAWLCFPILNQKNHSSNRAPQSRPPKQQQLHCKNSHSRHISTEANDPRSLEPHIVGRTLDLTLFSVIRAVDVLACASWAKWKDHRGSKGRWTRVESTLPKLADTGLFAASSAIVMWAWFYLPERLPYSYGRWISEAAQVDTRLIEALRTARRAEWKYGEPCPYEPPLESMCEDYGLPKVWGDPSKTVPFPCEIVHMGCGPSCEKHALWRFSKAFRFACTRYLPLQLVLRWRSSRSLSAFLNTVKTSFRSSAFLGLFVSLFYYAVCLARTRLGPKVFNGKTVTPMMWDSGLCVAAGCMMCGWSIFVESARRRQEIALFVAPRAAATVLPRRYERKVCIKKKSVTCLLWCITFS